MPGTRSLFKPLRLGGVTRASIGNHGAPLDNIDALLDRVFSLASRHGLAIDLHVDETHDPARRSFVEDANRPDNDFPIQNLPLGVFSTEADPIARARARSRRGEWSSR